MKMESMYEQLGVSATVYEYGERIIAELRDRFDAIDQTAEYNQAKVLSAMQKNRVNATHFAATTGYGYDDEGRDNLERVYADVFHTEAALVHCSPPWAHPMTRWRRSSASGRASAR